MSRAASIAGAYLCGWRMRKRPLVLENLAEITAIDLAAAGRASDEMFGLVFREVANTHV
jgi:hypothetical protein